MNKQTSELIGVELDLAVAISQGSEAYFWACRGKTPEVDGTFAPSTDWEEGGPIIERENIDTLSCDGGDYWEGRIYTEDNRIIQFGPTLLVAAMRCLVASKLGEVVDIPEELLCESKQQN